MSSEWMKVMLDEIARKKSEASETQAELERRRSEQQTDPTVGMAPAIAASGKATHGKPPVGRSTE